MDVPKTTDPMPAQRIAPWHIGQGSAVCIEDELGTIKGGAVGDQPVDGVDLPVSGGVLFRSVPALGDDFTRNAVDDDRSERSLRHLGCQGDGLSNDWFNGKVETCFNCSGLEILKKSSIGHLKGILKKLS